MVKIQATPIGGGSEPRQIRQHAATRPAFREKEDLSLGCESCGGPIVQGGRGRPRKFCEVCRPPGSKRKTDAQRIADNANRRERYRLVTSPAVDRYCEWCGVVLEGQHRVTCGATRCKDALWRWRNPEAEKTKQARKHQRRKLRAQSEAAR